jgi:hypothetical protein
LRKGNAVSCIPDCVFFKQTGNKVFLLTNALVGVTEFVDTYEQQTETFQKPVVGIFHGMGVVV